MKLEFDEAQVAYKSGSQSARVWTERWVGDRIFCPNCGNSKIDQFESNRPVADFFCSVCDEEYELKSQKHKFGLKILDGAFSTMCHRLRASNNPNLLLLNYDLQRLAVANVFVVPKHFFVREIIEERKPLAPTARRAGWIGCNILLNKIPPDARIAIVESGAPRAPSEVRQAYKRLRPLENLKVETRGWTLDVLNVVRSLDKKEFALADVYAHADKLSKLHPQNAHIPDKIRQQLQVLRDLKLLEFLTPGSYRLR